MYFVLFVVFLALVIGPIVAGKSLLSDSLTSSIPMNLYQPALKNNDTRNRTETGTGAKSGAGATAAKTASSGTGFGSGARVKLY